MSQHYTRNTVSASGWCKRCAKYTQHRVDDRRMGPCLDCIAKPLPVAKSEEPAAEQTNLFAEAAR